MDEIAFVRVELARLESLVAFVEQYYRFDEIPFDEDAVRRGARDLIENPTLGGAWLVEVDGRFVGHFVVTYGFDLEFGGRQATLTELFLVEECRSRGVGGAVLRFIEKTLDALGIGALELQVESDNETARGFYAKAGFEAHASRIPMSKRIAGPR